MLYNYINFGDDIMKLKKIIEEYNKKVEKIEEKKEKLKLWEKKSINGYKTAIDKAVSNFKDGTQNALAKEK